MELNYTLKESISVLLLKEIIWCNVFKITTYDRKVALWYKIVIKLEIFVTTQIECMQWSKNLKNKVQWKSVML